MIQKTPCCKTENKGQKLSQLAQWLAVELHANVCWDKKYPVKGYDRTTYDSESFRSD